MVYAYKHDLKILWLDLMWAESHGITVDSVWAPAAK
jgi:hypothetical protein